MKIIYRSFTPERRLNLLGIKPMLIGDWDKEKEFWDKFGKYYITDTESKKSLVAGGGNTFDDIMKEKFNKGPRKYMLNDELP